MITRQSFYSVSKGKRGRELVLLGLDHGGEQKGGFSAISRVPNHGQNFMDFKIGRLNLNAVAQVSPSLLCFFIGFLVLIRFFVEKSAR